MKSKKEKRGRKPVEDKKVRLDVFVTESIIELVGGKEAAKTEAIVALKTIADKKFQESNLTTNP